MLPISAEFDDSETEGLVPKRINLEHGVPTVAVEVAGDPHGAVDLVHGVDMVDVVAFAPSLPTPPPPPLPIPPPPPPQVPHPSAGHVDTPIAVQIPSGLQII